MVWETHIEFSGEYLEFSKFIFNRLFVPLLYSPFKKVNSNLVGNYQSTLDFYKILFNSTPFPLLWEEGNDRFKDEATIKICMSIYRIYATYSLKDLNSRFLLLTPQPIDTQFDSQL